LDMEADARHLKALAAHEQIDSMAGADDAVRTWEDAAKIQAKADQDLASADEASQKLNAAVMKKAKASLIAKGSEESVNDKYDAIRTTKLAALADEADAKHMQKFAEIEDEMSNSEEHASDEVKADADHLAAAAQKQGKQTKRLDMEADARHLKALAAHEQIDAMASADDAVRTWEDAAKIQSKADQDLAAADLASKKINESTLKKAAAEEE